MKRRWIVLALLTTFALVSGAQAMSSPNYRLDWYTPLTGGGNAASSASYAVNLTFGQSATGGSSSTGYAVGLGYWYGVGQQLRVNLPVVLR